LVDPVSAHGLVHHSLGLNCAFTFIRLALTSLTTQGACTASSHKLTTSISFFQHQNASSAKYHRHSCRVVPWQYMTPIEFMHVSQS